MEPLLQLSELEFFSLIVFPLAFEQSRDISTFYDLNIEICVIYLGDLIAFPDSYEHLEKFRIISNRPRERHLKPISKKRKIFQDMLKCIAPVVSVK